MSIKNKTGIQLIAKERKEQIKKHGRTIKKDEIHNSDNQLAIGAEMLLAAEQQPIEHPDREFQIIAMRALGINYPENGYTFEQCINTALTMAKKTREEESKLQKAILALNQINQCSDCGSYAASIVYMKGIADKCLESLKQ